MRTRGAIITEVPGKFEIHDLNLADPGQGELLVRMVGSGMCHSDLHYATGDMEIGILPMLCGHEGSGVVEAVGPNTEGYSVGDHVIFAFIAGCGKCRYCSRGQQNLCHFGAEMLTGSALEKPGYYRYSLTDGTPVGQVAGLGTFAEHTVVSTLSVVKVENKNLPLDVLSLLGCGVTTGWGSAVNSAEVTPGDTVIVMGVGGLGINAVQGAAHAGATTVIAVDPVQFKRDSALKLGATHAVATMDEATEIAKSFTEYQGADKTIITVGVVHGEHVVEAVNSIAKAGTVVVTGIAPFSESGADISFSDLTLMQKRIQGGLFGGSSPNYAIPQMVHLYEQGQLRLDELVTRRYRMEEVQQGYDDMEAGLNLRGLISYDL